MIVFQYKIILSNLNYEIKFHTGAHFTKQCGAELADPDVLKVAEAFKDIAPLITTMAISTDVPLVDSAFGKVQEGSPISYQHPVPGSWILFHQDASPPPPYL